MGFQKICVLGLGYIGLPTAAIFASNGLKVIGVDVNPHVIETLRNGEVHIYEPGLLDLFKQSVHSGNFAFSTQPEEADAFLIAVPTPFQIDEYGEYNGRKYKLADLQAVRSAAEAIAPYLRKGNLVILESTSPPRTTVEVVKPILESYGLKAGDDFYLCYSPERVLPGQILRELTENARVVGGVTPESAKAGRELYRIFVKGEIIETDTTTAEMVKLMENTTRDINIAIANEFSRLAEHFGVDIWEAISLANRHPRINILSPGPGVGGHCISVDPWFLVEAAPELASLIYQARQVNDAQPHFVAEKVIQSFAQSGLEHNGNAGTNILSGKKIAALGLVYKPNVADLRESPAIEVVRLLLEKGAEVSAWEPFTPGALLADIEMASSLDSAIKDADAILLLVKHTEFKNFSPGDIAARTKARIAIDTVNAWDANEWKKAGFRLYRLGARQLTLTGP